MALVLGMLLAACVAGPVPVPFQGAPAKLEASDASDDSFVGIAAALDAGSAVVGAPGDDLDGAARGSAYVFVLDGDSWVQQAKLTANDGADNDSFGYVVDLDGDSVIVGAPSVGTDVGAAYIFARSGDTWAQQAKLTAADGATGDRFGISVAIDGDTAVVGSYGSDPDGAAYVFTRSGDSWTQRAKLTPSDPDGGDQFGRAVALDGDTAVVGADFHDLAGVNRGAAYVYAGSGDAWTQQAKLTANDGADNDQFGRAVALDGDTAVIGSFGDDLVGAEEGSAYVFVRSGTAWEQEAKLIADDGASGDFFGISVAVDGDTVLVGAYQHDLDGVNEGSAFVFGRDGSTWTPLAKLTADDAADNDQFGRAVAFDGDTALVGAVGDDLSGSNEGSAYVFTR